MQYIGPPEGGLQSKPTQTGEHTDAQQAQKEWQSEVCAFITHETTTKNVRLEELRATGQSASCQSLKHSNYVYFVGSPATTPAITAT